MEYITDLKKWINNETITARDYVYERDTIVNAVNELIDFTDYLDQKIVTRIWVQETEPGEDEFKEFDLWYKIID